MHEPDQIPERAVDFKLQVPAEHGSVQRTPKRFPLIFVSARPAHPPDAVAAEVVPARKGYGGASVSGLATEVA